MSSSLALLFWFILLVALLCFDPARARTSPALWVPVAWMFILGSRLPSQWLGAGRLSLAAQALEEGNPLDRTISSVLILLAIGILTSRSFKWGAFFSQNAALTAFLFFALLSVLWSDSSFISFKRWFRDLGNYLMILVTLSDPLPLEAVRTLLRRLSFLLIPLSIVLVKYYPEMAKVYSTWTGIASYSGAATSKNMLGMACLISGLFFFWDTVTRWSDRKQRRTKSIMLVNIALIAMTFWLLDISKSATSRLCLFLGCFVILMAHSKAFQRHPGFFKALIPTAVLLYLVLVFGFDINAKIAGAVGRDPTLTDRTKIWSLLLSMQANPVLGAGYECFWLGPRLLRVWQQFGGLNEAHNGYLEVYLNLGIAGLFLLSVFLIASYRTICRRLTPLSSLASLGLALWTILLFYNVTEAGFRSGLMWLTFLLGAIVVPKRAEAPAPSVAGWEGAGAMEQLPNFPEAIGPWR